MSILEFAVINIIAVMICIGCVQLLFPNRILHIMLATVPVINIVCIIAYVLVLIFISIVWLKHRFKGRKYSFVELRTGILGSL